MRFPSIARLLSAAFLTTLLAGCAMAPEAPGLEVAETMNSGGYTYVRLADEWYAVPECEVTVGDRVEVEQGAMLMQDFESRTLNRKFAQIYFAGGLEVLSR